ncbi:hypothetical protein BLNAU_15877 [Blattamonas nauphoetae]|uniref:Protein kinase domain-containing protein n=1 Tax=Blattamonas nauphoetae TaxID=2049346 RepID=A0ABQ9XFV9_9EUKA|nr:hypothetical protein BLNAU_15877 [Blattamonas nauphoetae]
MSFASIRNVSSGAAEESISSDCEISQSLIGCSVQNSTNHISGTSIRDVNLGGSLICSNSSFVSCERTSQPNSEHILTNENYTSSPRFVYSAESLNTYTSATFTLCTFTSLKTPTGGNLFGGGAILISNINTDLTVTSCSFRECLTEQKDSDGGAICASNTAANTQKVEIGHSTFFRCKAFCESSPLVPTVGGAAVIYNIVSVKISSCVFDGCYGYSGGSLYLRFHPTCSLSDLLFSESVAVSGGAIDIRDMEGFSMTSVAFRGCQCNQDYYAKDVYISTAASGLDFSGNFQFCDSTSGEANVNHNQNRELDVVPQVTQAVRVDMVNVDTSKQEAIITVKTSTPVKGKMGICLLDNTGIPRSVFVDFGSTPSTTGIATATLGTDGLFQTGRTYTVSSLGIVGWRPLDSYVYQAVAERSEKVKAAIMLSGFGLPDGLYSMVVEDSSSASSTINLQVSGTDPIIPAKHTTLTTTTPLSLPNSNGDLTYNTKYKVKSIQSIAESVATSVFVNEGITFTTPTAPGWIDSLSVTPSGDRKTATINLVGRELVNAGYKVTFENKDKTSWTLDISGMTPTSCFFTVSTDDKESSASLEYGASYTIVSISTSSNSLVLPQNPVFQIPHPPRITAIDTTLSSSMTHFDVSVSGTHLPVSGVYTLTFSEHNTPMHVTFGSEGGKAESVKAGLPQEYQFNTEYSFDSMVLKGGDSVVFGSGKTMKTPKGPTLSKVVATLDSSNLNKLVLTIESSDIPSGEYSLNLKENEQASAVPLVVSFSAPTSATEELEIYSSQRLKYGATYEISNLTSASVHALITAPPFKIPDPPARIVSCTCELGRDKMTKALVTFSGSSFPPQTPFTLIVKQMNDQDQEVGDDIRLAGSFGGESGTELASHLMEIEVYVPTERTLSFGTNYKVTKLDISDVDSIVHNSVVFSVDPEPPRLLDVSTSHTNDSITLTFGGSALDSGDATVVLTSNVSHTPTITLAVSSHSSSESTEFRLFPRIDDDNQLKYNTKYTVDSMFCGGKQVIRHSTVEFSTDPAPERLLDLVNGSFSDHLQTTIPLDFSGHGLRPSAEYSVSLTSVHTNGTPPHTRSLTLTATTDTIFETFSAVLYPSKPDRLMYGTEYNVTAFERDSTVLMSSSTTFKTPSEPVRLEGADAVLSTTRVEAIVTLSGVKLTPGTWAIELIDTSTSATSSHQITLNSDLTFILPVSSSSSTESLQYEHNYTIKAMSGNDPVVVNDEVFFIVPKPPRISTVKAVFANIINTTFHVELAGEGFPLKGIYNLTLTTGEIIPISFDSATSGLTTDSHLLGGAKFEYGTTYTIESVHLSTDQSDHVLFDSPTFATGPKPKTIALNVDSSSPDITAKCGDDSPCSTIDAAWGIVDRLGISQWIANIITKTKQEKKVLIKNGEIGVFARVGFMEPILTIPSTASSSGQSGMVEVQKGSFELRDVNVEIGSSSTSFVFLSALEGVIVMHDSLIMGITPPSNEASEEDTSICGWETGLIRLENSSTSVFGTGFTQLPQGVFRMNGGDLHIVTSSFDGNSPMQSSFSSTRRNIFCSGEGIINVGAISGGDGQLAGSSAWMWLSECSLTSTSININAPFFIPTLDTANSSIKLNKKNKNYALSLVGSTFIPCGLFAEIFEYDPNTKLETENHFLRELNTSTTSLSETAISFSLTSSELQANLNETFEWRTRLMYGNNETTSWLRLKDSLAAEKKAQLWKNMKWIIPIVAACSVLLLFLLIIIVLLYRRKQKKSQTESTTTELDEADLMMDVEKIEERETVEAVGANQESTIQTDDVKKTEIQKSFSQDTQVGLGQEYMRGVDHGVPVVVNKKDTLYERLHGEKKREIDRTKLRREIVDSLKLILKRAPASQVLTNFSSHWVLFGPDDAVHLKLQKEETETADQSKTVGYQNNDNREDIRWKAPEAQEERSTQNFDKEKALVFSLGLVLYEIETGSVPHPETNAIDAAHQLGTGVLPRMELVKDPSMKVLIEKCLNVMPCNRPTLDDVSKSLNGSVYVIEESGSLIKAGRGKGYLPLAPSTDI